jgi:transcriptional regulator with XRE-family HTH domain
VLSSANQYLIRITEVHERSGLSYREVAQACDLDPSYVHYILKGARRPRRDVLISLGFAYRLDRWEMDEILLLAGLPPIGRSAVREYRQELFNSNQEEAE